MPGEFVASVRSIVSSCLGRLVEPLLDPEGLLQLAPGKMLRTRLAARLVLSGGATADPSTLHSLCAATEMAHTASLCHDDVIDGAELRRARLSLWRCIGASTAVLVGDMLLCEATDLVLRAGSDGRVRSFVAKLREVCSTEVEQELRLRGRHLDEETCIRVARSKTGPLFAFTAEVCGGDDDLLCSALEEAGYRVGTAYQLADDLLDAVGRERAAGKTLGTDLQRRKYTLPSMGEEGARRTRDRIAQLCASALDGLDAWPECRRGLEQYLTCDVQPVFDTCAPILHHVTSGMSS